MSEAAPPAPRVGVRAAAVVGAALLTLLLSGSIAPVDLITPGGRGPSAAVIARDFGVAAVPTDRTGYDGQQSYAIAREFPDLTAAADHLDAPRYRLLRIAAPALASIGGEGTPVVLLLTLFNVVGVGLACWALASLCADRGWHPNLGYLAAPPVLFGVVGTTVDPLSFGLALTALVFAGRGRHGAAITTLTLAALTREQVAVVGLAAAAGLLLGGHRRWILAGYLVPLAAVGGWYLWLGVLVGGRLPDRFDVLAMLSTGVEGFAVGVLSLGVSLWGAWAWRQIPTVWPVALVFGLWILVYFEGTFDLEALPRTTAPSLAIGLAAIGHAAFQRQRAAR